MLEFEVAAIYYFIDSAINVTPYFEAVPEDMLTPCVFYPTPDTNGQNFSLSTYATEFVMYVKLIDSKTMDTYLLAAEIMEKILSCRNKIPLVDQNGKLTGKNFRINNPVAKKVDEGVYQVELSWKRYTAYSDNAFILAKDFYFNGNPIKNL